MRATLVLALALVASASGCVRMGIDAIDRARQDANVSESTLPNATTPAPTAPWPREGSVVAVSSEYHDASEDTYANATWTYHAGDWRGACDGTKHANGTTTPVHAIYEAAHPPHWPLLDAKDPPATGANVTAWILVRCAIGTVEGAVFAGTEAGRYVATQAQGDAGTFRTEWSPASGVVLAWDLEQPGFASRGAVLTTDAPR